MAVGKSGDSKMASQDDYGSLQTRVRFLEDGLTSLTTEVRTGFNSISQQIASDRRPQWQAYGVMLSALIVLGGMAYWPIRETLLRLDDATQHRVTTREFEITQDRGREVRENFQRQIDEIKSSVGGTYNMRDVILDIKKRQEERDELIIKLLERTASNPS